jgi:aspartate kinase
MAIIVQKFGGTSLANIECIKNVANIIQAELNKGNKVAVVVSAMAGMTDRLIGWAEQLSSLTESEQLAEYDVVVSTGEQVNCGLLALALQAKNIRARSWLGWQLPVTTDDIYSKARIESISTQAIIDGFSRNEVAIIPGFQGINEHGRITSLGRGGSDTSAVALAASLGAERCDIYTDVEGVYTTDPRIVNKARKLAKISYEEMLEMASLGAKVLQTRSVEIAMKYHVPIQVLSSFNNNCGTFVVDEDDDMEKNIITGIAYSLNDACITLVNVPNKPGISAAIFGPLAAANINVDMIVQNIGTAERADMTFTVLRSELNKALTLIEKSHIHVEYESLRIDDNVAKISIVGVGMRSHSGVAELMFRTLAEKGINIMLISTSEIKISVLVAAEYTELAMRALHTAFELDDEGL